MASNLLPKFHKKPPQFVVNAFLLIGIIIYSALSFYQINLPGLHYDEAFEAVPALQLLKGQPVTAFRGVSLTVGQTHFPLMTQDYIGAINTYISLPFIALFGATPAALRTMSILGGIITLLLTYTLAQKLTGNQWVGVIAVLLLSVDPTFVFWNRQGVFVTAITAPIAVATSYCWLKRFESGKTRWSIIGAFLLGVGLYAKLLFLWFIVALVGTAILLNLGWLWSHRKDLMTSVKRVSPIEIGSGLVTFLLGCWPLIIYNLQTGGTFQNISQNATTSYYGVDNLAFGSNLIERLKQFTDLLQGNQFWFLGGVSGNFWGAIIFFVVVILVTLLATRILPVRSVKVHFDRSLSPKQTALFPLLIIALVILASIGTVSALWITHFAILMPWPALAITIGGWYILSYADAFPFKFDTLLRYATVVIVGLLFVTNLSSTLRYHALLAESGGLSDHSDAIYDLTAWLTDHAEGQVAAMDWGLAAPVIYLTHGEVATIELFGYTWETDNQFTDRLTNAINQPTTLYLWRTPEEIIFDRSNEFKGLYRPLNLEENIEEAFYERSGRPLLGVTRLVEKGTASNPP